MTIFVYIFIMVGIVKGKLGSNGDTPVSVTEAFNAAMRALGQQVAAISSSPIIENHYCKINFATAQEAQHVVDVVSRNGGSITFLGAEVRVKLAEGKAPMTISVASEKARVVQSGAPSKPFQNKATIQSAFKSIGGDVVSGGRGGYNGGTGGGSGGGIGGKAALKELESCYLNSLNTDIVRVSNRYLVECMGKADAVYSQCSVTLKKLSSTTLLLQGSYENLFSCRMLLCQLTSLATNSCLYRLIVEKHRFIRVSSTEQQFAIHIWKGRRVFIRNTGNLAVVESMRFVNEQIFVSVRMDQSDNTSTDYDTGSSLGGGVGGDSGETEVVQEYTANEVICWDELGLVDAVTVVHPPGSNEQYLRRIFGKDLGLPVEQVDFVRTIPGKGADTLLSRVTFDVSCDPRAPGTI